MSTGIQWTDETWNPVVGCTKVSQGCKNCYAKQIHDQRHKALLEGKPMAPQYARPFEEVQLMAERLEQPLHWRKPRRVFVNSVSDLFHEDVPDAFLDQVFAVMAKAQAHTFQVLTKRPERMRDYSLARLVGLPLPNVWLGVSVEDQKAADERIPILLDTPAAVRFLSCEPLLGALDLSLYLEEEGYLGTEYVRPLDWVIAGGESGRKARGCSLGWLRQIVTDCKENEVAVFVKQLGSSPFDWEDDGVVGVDLRDSHGGDPAEWPEDLRVREFPVTA